RGRSNRPLDAGVAHRDRNMPIVSAYSSHLSQRSQITFDAGLWPALWSREGFPSFPGLSDVTAMPTSGLSPSPPEDLEHTTCTALSWPPRSRRAVAPRPTSGVAAAAGAVAGAMAAMAGAGATAAAAAMDATAVAAAMGAMA